jgi:hypothetical protein
MHKTSHDYPAELLRRGHSAELGIPDDVVGIGLFPIVHCGVYLSLLSAVQDVHLNSEVHN